MVGIIQIMEVLITKHALQRLAARKITKEIVEEIANNPEEEYYDNIEKSLVAIKTMPYGGKNKKIGIFFHYEGLNVKIHTVHPESKEEIKKRIKSGRYTKR